MRIGLFKLASCSGCLVEFLNVLARRPGFLKEVEIVSPLLGDDVSLGGFDAVFIEGSISDSEHEDLVRELRRRAKWLILLGTCALYGGLQNIGSTSNRPVSMVVDVDYVLPGCPVNSVDLYNLLFKLVLGGLDIRIYESLCMECKRRGLECLLISKNIPCLGPLTRSGCGALCPSMGRGCIGCYGFRVDAGDREVELLRKLLDEKGYDLDRFKVFLKAHGSRK